MQLRTAFRFLSFIALAFFALTASLRSANAQAKAAPAQQNAAANPANPKIRAITAFINLDRAQYQQQIADALKMLKRAQTTLESRGYQVQTIRIATQPFPEYTKGLTNEQAVAFFKQLDALAEQQKFAMAIGPAMLNANDSAAQADLLAEILSNTKKLNGTVVVAGEDGVRWSAVGAAARVMKKLEESTEHSQGNFRFAAIALVPPLTPLFPAAYHTGFRHQFAIAMDALLSYSAVCGTGLDTILLPGDTSAEQLAVIISDMASLAVKWHKPLSARLLPVTGKGWGETTDFDDPFLVNATLQQLDKK